MRHFISAQDLESELSKAYFHQIISHSHNSVLFLITLIHIKWHNACMNVGIYHNNKVLGLGILFYNHFVWDNVFERTFKLNILHRYAISVLLCIA